MRYRLVFACLFALSGAVAPAAAGERETARYLDEIRDQPVRLGMFLRAMPKGGDLHNHLSGAIYAESFLAWAAQDGRCITVQSLSIAKGPCGAGQVSAASVSPALYRQMVDALSMKDFFPGAESGHDHFFATFAKFGAAEESRTANMLAEAAMMAAADHTSYLELMWSPGMAAARALGAKAGWNPDLARLKDTLAPGIPPIVAEVRRSTDAAEAGMRRLLRCGTREAQPACQVTIRYLAQAIRTFPPEQILPQFMLGEAVVGADPRFVGLNFVAPEDDPVALRDYDLHMRMLKLVAGAPVSLHAGELVLGLVPPGDLRFHIRHAIEIAGARRIGHGVDLMYEDDAPQLLAEMARRHVLVEINLTSNDEILGVKGKDHPFMTYWKAGVPVALSTDDEGVSRIDLTHEFLRAVQTYRLSYPDLKKLVKNSLQYAFLAEDDRTRLLRQTEEAFKRFEAQNPP